MTAIPIHQENTNTAEDIEILLSVNFRWILFSGFKKEVKNVSANQRSRPAILVFQSTEKNPTNLVGDI